MLGVPKSGEAAANMEQLAANPYPGRGIVLGLGEKGDQAVLAYWLMGRSPSSQNRVFEQVDISGDPAVKTRLFDESIDAGDPDLLIYNAIRATRVGKQALHIVSNGSQTDRIVNSIEEGDKSPRIAFGSTMRKEKYEPDAPNYTPRIAGFMQVSSQINFCLSVVSKPDGSDLALHKPYDGSLNNGDFAGVGFCIHTYLGDSKDSEPLPAFDKHPYPVEVGANAMKTAKKLQETLNPENFVAIAVKTIDLKTGEVEIAILNRHQT